jgi:hypothetical protein
MQTLDPGEDEIPIPTTQLAGFNVDMKKSARLDMLQPAVLDMPQSSAAQLAGFHVNI